MTSRAGDKRGISTNAIHGVANAAREGPVVTPISQSVNYVQEIGTAEGLRYGRYGNSPNADALHERLALLDGAEAALFLSSGMGATACALLALLRPGDHLLASSWIYGGTHSLFTREFASLGIEVTLVDPSETRGWRRSLRKETRAIFLENPVNPTCRVIDLAPISFLAHDLGLALVVDATLASPVNLRPIEKGADVVIHSATKYLNGHHDVLGGAVLGTASYIEEVRQKMIVWGQAPDPFSCWLVQRGLKTLELRVLRQNENALKVAQWADKRPEVARVHYPGLSSHPDHKLAKKMMDGFGGMLSLELAGKGKAADKFLRKLKLCTHAASLGGVDTLVSEPRYSSHAHLTSAERAAIGIPDGFLRFSIGVENADDIITDIEQALR
jgi:cystathionine beta-lyase/cystathionine gamma-synthase